MVLLRGDLVIIMKLVVSQIIPPEGVLLKVLAVLK